MSVREPFKWNVIMYNVECVVISKVEVLSRWSEVIPYTVPEYIHFLAVWTMFDTCDF